MRSITFTFLCRYASINDMISKPNNRYVVMRKLEKKIKLVAANGTPINVEGEQVVEFKKDGKRYGMNFLITDVKKPLAAVGAIVDQGNRVVFDGGHSWWCLLVVIAGGDCGWCLLVARAGGVCGW